MESVFAAVAGIVVACAVYLLLDRSLARVALGVILLSAGVNLGLFVGGRMSRGRPPLIPAPLERIGADAVANPLSQALILTAIVISFGLTALLLVLMLRTARDLGTLDVDRLRISEPPDEASRP